MPSKEYLRNRTIVFENHGINPKDKTYNCHHIYFRSDVDSGRVPRDFPIDAVENLLPLKKTTHDALNVYINQHPEVIEDISTRVNLAHMAEIGELDHLAPIEVRCKKPRAPRRRHKK